MSFPKPSIVHFLALSLALNLVLLGLVGYFLSIGEPKSVTTAAPSSLESTPQVSRPASLVYEPAPDFSPAPVVSTAQPQATPSAPASPASVTEGSWSVPAEFAASRTVTTSSPSGTVPAPVISHDVNAPGNSFKFGNMVVAVEGESTAADVAGPGLLVSVSGDVPVSSAGVSSSGAGNSSTGASETSTVPNQKSSSQNDTNGDTSGASGSKSPGVRRSGSPFTYEEELFRTKWGWQAFNEAQAAAAAQAAATATPRTQ